MKKNNSKIRIKVSTADMMTALAAMLYAIKTLRYVRYRSAYQTLINRRVANRYVETLWNLCDALGISHPEGVEMEELK